MQSQDKISAVEWRQYEKHLTEIYKADGIDVVKKKLKIIQLAIEKNEGFE